MEFLFVVWEGEEVAASEERRAEAMNLMGAYVLDLLGKGKLKGGGPLRPASEALTARTESAKPTVVDGHGQPSALRPPRRQTHMVARRW